MLVKGKRLKAEGARRRGVILLVVMVLLALMTLMGLTLVLVTAQGRLSAIATAQAGLQSEHDVKELATVVSGVITGSNDPNSSFGAHGLLEDLYGLPQFFGRIFPGAGVAPAVIPIGETSVGTGLLAGGSNGQLLQLTVIAAQSAGATGIGPQSVYQYQLPQTSGAFCGQVITMLTGPASGQSGRVVGYYFNPLTANANPQYAIMQVSSFGGVVPNPGDEFMINGRPYSGTGFGLNLAPFQGGLPWQAPYFAAGGNAPLLTALETAPPVAAGPLANVQASNNIANPALASWGMPYAFMPNHARISVTAWSPTTTGTYWDIAGPGGAHEPYDAPDYQNMMLGMHYWHPTSGVAGTGAVITPIPSLHRPELVAWFYNQAIVNANPAMSMANAALRRKVILRPEPSDHLFNDLNGNGVWDAREPFHDVDGSGGYSAGDVYTDPVSGKTYPAFLDLNGDGVWTPGDTDYSGNMFNPITGCWYITATGGWALDTGAIGGLDVDNDGDTVNDSIWVDAGLQVSKGSDGNYYKNLAAVLCIDLDGKINLNAHGNLAQLDPLRYGANSVGGPLSGTTGSALLYKDAYERNVPVSQGYGPADVNLLPLFVRSETATTALNYYNIFLQGFNAGNANTTVDGRLGESTRLTLPTTPGFNFPGVYPPGSYGNSPVPPTPTQMLLSGPRPGWSDWFDAYLTSQLPATNAVYSAFGQVYWPNDVVAMSRFSDVRPGLLFPNLAALQFGAVPNYPFFFDFLAGAQSHLPTGHGSPSDLHSRGMLTTDFAGRPYYGGTTNFPWQSLPAYWSSTLVDLATSQYTSSWPAFLPTELVLNEGIDTQYEMDLTQNAAQAGRNTGNNLKNIPDYASVDMKFAPYELEGVLRSHEWYSSVADSSLYVKRLNAIESAAGTGNTTTALGNDKARLALTTESWDLPMPNIAPTPQQMADIVKYVDFYSGLPVTNPLGNTANLNISNLSLVDLARVRIFADNYDPATGVNPNFPLLSGVIGAADVSLFGNMKNIQQGVTGLPVTNFVPVWPLLAPETVLGMRFDVNRLLGNGQDDNGNGVVDEPAEVFFPNAITGYGEALLYPYSQLSTNNAIGPTTQINPVTGMPNMLAVLDLNNDGFYPVLTTGFTSVDPQTSPTAPNYLPADITGADSRARQLLAKQLYCLMMLLLDDRPYPAGTPQTVMAQIFNSAGPTMAEYLLQSATYPGALATNTTGCPDYVTLSGMPREQAAYVIAQWAINVVDFRDRDSIMTPFEFDIYPFRADPYVPPAGNPNGMAVQTSELNVTWNVDDIIDPFNGTPLPYSHMDDSQAYRGLVWGCERPELLLTETAAFHDRGTADTSNAQTINDPVNFPMSPTGPDTLTTAPATTMPRDVDFDQVRRPRGSLVVELFNPTNYWDPPQYDMQTSAAAPQPWTLPDMNGNKGTGVNLAQIATGQPPNASGLAPLSSPVWRIVVAYSPWQANESLCYTAPTGVTGPIGGGGWAASPQGLGQQLDARAPVLPPGAIHRAVYFAPFQPSLVTGGGAALTNLSVVGDTLLNNSFFADPDIFTAAAAGGASPLTLLLPPGQYALVAPANQNPAGSGNYFVYAGQYSPGTVPPYPWTLQLGNVAGPRTVATLYGGAAVGGAPSGPYAAGTGPTGQIKPVIGVPIQTNWIQSVGGNPGYVQHNSAGPTGVSAGATVATTVRMSVSEPEHGYPVWPGASLQDDSAYYTTVGSPAAGVSNFPQHPFDSSQGDPTSATSAPFSPYLKFGDLPNPYVAPPTGAASEPQSTTLGYTVLYLQRLANPLQAWDEKLNPYITVDSMPVDLTAYTGEPTAGGAAPPELPPAGMTTTYTGTGGPNPASNAGGWSASPGTATSFDTRRRGYAPGTGGLLLTAASPVPNVWTPLPTTGANVYAGAGYGNNGSGSYISPMPISAYGGGVGSTPGFVNWEYSFVPPAAVSAFWTAGAAPVGTSGMPASAYNGDPPLSFPWLTWNNRPYISQFELMLVPASSPSSMAQDFGMLGWQSAGASSMNEFQPGATVATKLPVSQFEHLLNFFNNQQPVAGAPGTSLPNLYRVFEFLQVPSRYTATQDLLNPSQFSGDVSIQQTTASTSLPSASHMFHTPFNWLSRYRDPGRINLNTIFDPVVFKALMDDYPGTLYGAADPMLVANPANLWQQLLLSRQGFVNDPTRLLSGLSTAPPNPVSQFAYNTASLTPGINADIPTYFANPFRPDGSGAFVPMADINPLQAAPLSYTKLMQQWHYPGGGLTYAGVNTTMLRPSPTTASLGLFDDTAFDTNNLGVTYVSNSSSSPAASTQYRHAGQDAAFQYQMFTRLGNTVTNRSNVYAIWVTLGKFQVQSVAVSPTNPDGYKLTGPALDDTGKQIITRGFYIFDRSIPMGCQRGQDLNIEHGFLLERVLQEGD